jgi:PilZ domain-containing protein
MRVTAMNEHTHERRAHARHRVFKGGRLAFDDGGVVDCTVRNLSPGGARLDIASAIGLPSRFTLCIDSDHFVRHCHPVWCHDNHIGVAFD